MEQRTQLLIIIFVCLLLTSLSNAQQVETTSKKYDWTKGGNTYKPINLPNGQRLSLIKVKGNRFVNTQGDTILFRGVAIADPDKIDQQGHWNKTIFEKVKELGAKIVRIPVHPATWRTRTPEKYLLLLDQAVDWCMNLACMS